MREEPREERTPVRGQTLIALLAGCAALAGCNRAPPSHGPSAHAPDPLAGYLQPPQVVQADRRGQTVQLTIAAAPGSVIRLASPDGAAITGAADRKGAASLAAPAGPSPRLYSLSEMVGGRLARAVGYVAVLPAPGPPAALLRPAAAAALPSTRAPAERGLLAVDYDASGAAMASGRAGPSETVRLLLDGKDTGEDPADAAGVFSASLSKALTPGPHVLSAAGQRLRASIAFTAARPTGLANTFFEATRLDSAWRIDWLTPGGGVQSTILFDQRGGPG